MELTLNSKHELTGSGYFFGIDNENRSEQLIINIEPEELLNKWAYIEFQVNEEKPYNTERLDIVDGKITYDKLNSLLKKGYVKVQVIFRDDNNFVWKSFIKRFPVSASINACQNLPEEYPDFITEAQKLLDEISVDADKIDEVIETEAARVKAEAIRVENENTRITNENNRSNAEQTRSTAETERISNEKTRQSNEVARVTAETERETKFNTWENTLGVLDNLSNALKGTASGEVIRVDDVSPVEHNAKVKVQGKNLANLYLANGIGTAEITVEDNSIMVAASDNMYGIRFEQENLNLVVGETYTASVGNITDYADGSWGWRVLYIDSSYEDVQGSRNKIYTFTPKKEVKALQFYIGSPYAGNQEIVISDIQIELGDTATEYTPYVDPTSVTVTRCGKNIIKYPFINTTKTMNGITFTDNGDGSITVVGTATDGAYFVLMDGDFGSLMNAGNSESSTNGKFTISKGLYYNASTSRLSLNIKTGVTINETFYPQLEVGTKATYYETYKGETYTPNTDGSLTIASITPTMTLLTDKNGVNIDLEYNQDINKVIKSLQDKINALTK